MADEIEADYKTEYWNEDKHCHFCDSFKNSGGKCFCSELEMEIAEDSHCDFFRSKD